MRALSNQPGASDLLKPPVEGWPDYPAGGDKGCQALAQWLYPSGEIRPLTETISCPSDAQRWVYAVGCYLLEDLRSEHKSLTIAAERDRLSDIVKHAKELRKKIKAYGGHRGHLRRVSTDCGFLQQKAESHGLDYTPVPADEILDKPLSSLIDIAEEAQSALLKSFEEQTRRYEKQTFPGVASFGRPRDKIWSRLYGDPRHAVTVRCARLLVLARGEGAAPISEGGVVAEFARRMWEYATGFDPGVALDRTAKVGAAAAQAPGSSVRRGDKMARKLSLLP